MFTGIVQGVGEIIAIREPSADFRTHVVKLPDRMTEHLQIGASVANNGCCLTITQIDGDTGGAFEINGISRFQTT